MSDTIQILVFIATIVIFVISALRKQKNKQQTESSDLHETIEELFGIPSVPQKTVVIKQEVTDVKSGLLENRTKTNAKPKTNIEGEKSIIVNQNSNVEANITQEEKTLEFDLKQAIIYSTIMESKYF